VALIADLDDVLIFVKVSQILERSKASCRACGPEAARLCDAQRQEQRDCQLHWTCALPSVNHRTSSINRCIVGTLFIGLPWRRSGAQGSNPCDTTMRFP